MSSVVFSPDGSKIAGGAEDASVLVWDAVRSRVLGVADDAPSSADGDTDAPIVTPFIAQMSQTQHST
jgi:WD40 repeat protein